jgi:hypothetical protein
VKRFVVNKKLFMIVAALLVGALFIFVGDKFGSQRASLKNLSESEIPVSVSDERSESTDLTPPPSAEGATSVSAAFKNEGGGGSKDLPPLSEPELKKWLVFQEIMKSKNDNDPRLDRDLNELTPGLRQALRQKYSQLPPESRNERGLIAYLVARDLRTVEDLDFLKSVFEEAPCLSLENCTVRSNSEAHLSGIDQTSMNYPQLAPLYQLEKQIEKNPERFQDSKMKDHLRALLGQAKQFGVPIVRNKADEISGKLHL